MAAAAGRYPPPPRGASCGDELWRRRVARHLRVTGPAAAAVAFPTVAGPDEPGLAERCRALCTAAGTWDAATPQRRKWPGGPGAPTSGAVLPAPARRVAWDKVADGAAWDAGAVARLCTSLRG
eukprot:gene32276-38859_t